MAARHRASASGFTLVEVLCVLAIVASLAALLQPALSSALASSRRSVSTHNLRQLHLALKVYQSEHGGEGIYGKASEMGLPEMFWMYGPPADPSHVVANTRGLWLSPCGTHPDQGMVPEATNNLTYYATDLEGEYWPTYSQRYQEASMLLIDKNCVDHSIPLDSPYRQKTLTGIRLVGSLATVRTTETVELWPWHQ